MHRVGTYSPAWKNHVVLLALFIALGLLLVAVSARSQNVGVSTSTPDNSALLELKSTSKGFLIPRLTGTQMNLVSSPATGDLVYNTTASAFYYYDGSQWDPLGSGQTWSLTGNYGTSASTNFLGTKDAVDLVQKTDATERMRVFNGGGVGLKNSNNSAESMIFWDASSSSLFTAFKAGTQDSTLHYTLPTSDGAANAALYDSLGTLGWHIFATYGGSLNDTCWLRGAGTYAEYGVGTKNSAGGQYGISGGKYTSAGGTYAMAWGDSCSAGGIYTMTGGGFRNSSESNETTTRGGSNNGQGDDHTYCGGGLDNSLGGSYDIVMDGDSNFTNGGGLVYNTIINGHHIKSGKSFELYFGDSITAATTGWNIFYKPAWSPLKMGIQTCSPTQALDVVGNFRFSLVLKPNGTGGTSGQYLLSAGSSSPPTWGSATFTSTNWKLAGTSGTAPATNYVGTADAQDFAIRTNNSESMRVTSTGFVGVGTSSPADQFASVSSSTTDETAAVLGNATGATTLQSIGIWGAANTASSNTGTIGLLACGSGSTTAGATNVALQLNDGELAMGRTTEISSLGTIVEPAASGTAYSQQGPSGVIQFSLGSDFAAGPPTAGVYEDLGTVTLTNRYITANSIVIAEVIQKINGGGSPDPKNSVYKVDVQSTSAGSCVIHVGMIPFVTDPGGYQGSDFIRVGYVVINPGR